MDSTQRRVLVVDDDRAFREMIADAVEAFGFAPCVAASAAEALSVAALLESPPAFLVTDVVMPGASGVELARALSVRIPSLGVVFVSGYPEDVIAGHGLPATRVGFLRKPFPIECLESALEAIGDPAESHPGWQGEERP